MGNERIDLRGWSLAAILAAVCIWLGGVCIQIAAVQVLKPTSPIVSHLSPDDPGLVLARATYAMVKQHGIHEGATLTGVRRAAASAPLDARPFLILGHEQLLDGRPDRAILTLAAGQRLDPRERLIHALLLDRYMRTERYADATVQLAVLARLGGGVHAPVVKAMAEMSLMPATRDAVRRTLRTDPTLERAVLVALVRAGTAPGAIFALASPVARATAGTNDSWGSALVNQLIEQRRYGAARAVWRHIYGIGDRTSTIFNVGFRPSPASPPFNWTLTAGELGAAEMRNGALAIKYYGRDSGDLASQLLVLPPGRYRFSVTVDPGKTDTASRLIWSLGCHARDTALMNLDVIAAPAARRLTADLVVPADCPAQMLTLRGEAGEFPAPNDISVRDSDIRPVMEQAS